MLYLLDNIQVHSLSPFFWISFFHFFFAPMTTAFWHFKSSLLFISITLGYDGTDGEVGAQHRSNLKLSDPYQDILNAWLFRVFLSVEHYFLPVSIEFSHSCEHFMLLHIRLLGLRSNKERISGHLWKNWMKWFSSVLWYRLIPHPSVYPITRTMRSSFLFQQTLPHNYF